MDDFAVSVTGTYRKFTHLAYTIPVGTNASTYAFVDNAQGTAVAGNGFTLPFNEPFYGLTLDEAPGGQEILNRPGADQTFWGVELAATKRLTNHWMMRASFAWQDWRQHIQPQSILNPNNLWDQGAPNINDGIAVGYGRDTIWFNASWQFNVSGMYQLPYGFAFAANFFGRQGYPQSYYVRSRIPGDNLVGVVSTSRIDTTIGALDTYRLPNVYDLDLRLEKTFQIGQVTVTPMVDLFNATNAGAVLQRQNEVGSYFAATSDSPAEFDQSPTFNQIVETQSPRIMRLGIRVSF